MTVDETLDGAVERYQSSVHDFEVFLSTVQTFFLKHPELNQQPLPVLHSLKSRLKDPEHLREKLLRKWDDQDPIVAENLFDRVTDLAGVRVLHLHMAQFAPIHHAIMTRVENGDWVLNETPVAYSWDPEAVQMFEDLGVETKIKPSLTSSKHVSDVT